MLSTPFTEVVSCILGFKVILVDQLVIPRAVCLPYKRPQYFEYDLDHNYSHPQASKTTSTSLVIPVLLHILCSI